MTCAEIIESYLKEKGFDGLYYSEAGCGCKLDDLFPCCEDPFQCKPGYIKYKSKVLHDWVIGPEKLK